MFVSPLPKPFDRIAVHSWIVTNKASKEVNRWEVWQHRNKCSTAWGYVHKNLLPIEAGMNRSPFTLHRDHRWESQMIGKVEGPLASKMIRFVNIWAPRYFFSQWYFIWPGPNSNTFIQWILNTFPEANLSLPKTAKGKAFPALLFTKLSV